MTYYCSICEKPISEKEFFYSKQHFCRSLCRYHQTTIASNQGEKSASEQKLDVVSGVNKIMRGVSHMIKERAIKNETDFNKWTAEWRHLKQLNFSMETKHFFLIGMDL